MKNQTLYFHKDLNVRCLMIRVWSSGSCLMETKQGVRFHCKIEDLIALY